MRGTDRPVLVTGATGFVGSAVLLRLRASGYRVRGLVRPTSDVGELQRKAPDIALRRGDLADRGSLVSAMEGCAWVLHCAGLNSFWEREVDRYQHINVAGTRNVMQAAHQAGVAKVVHVSTVMAYGFPEKSPFTEDSAPGPHASAYARSKHLGDQIAWDLHHAQGLPLVVVYLAAVVGAGDRKPVMQVGRFLEGRVPVLIDSPHAFTYVAIQDAAEAIVRAAEAEDNIGERYLVGDQRLTTLQYFQMISELSGVPMPRRTIGRRLTLFLARLMTAWSQISGTPPLMPLDLMRTVTTGSLVFDGRKAVRELGISYTPIRVALKEAIAELSNARRNPT
jgi:dihydroflavonol-4-reductase